MQLLIAVILIYLIYLIQRQLFQRNWKKNLTVSVSFEEPVITEGLKSHLIEVVENKKKMPIPLLQIKFALSSHLQFQKDPSVNTTDQIYRNNVYTIGKNERITRTYPFYCDKRGCYELNRIDLSTRDYFLESLYAKQLVTNQTLIVCPSVYEKRQLPKQLNVLLNDIVTPFAINEDVFEFKGIREYQPYDNMHYINWKQTAKLQTPMVNTHAATCYLKAELFLDLDVHTMRHPDILQEAAIKMANTLAASLSDKNIIFRCQTNAKDCYTHQEVKTEFGSGKIHLKNLGNYLARIDLTQPFSDITLLINESLKKNQNACLVFVISTHEELTFPQNCLVVTPILSQTERKKSTPNKIYWEVTLDGKEVRNTK